LETQILRAGRMYGSVAREPLAGTWRQGKPDTCLILQYQRVALLQYDPLGLATEPVRFEAQMAYLAENCNVVSIDEFDSHRQAGVALAPRSVIVTFDGGYADVFYTAAAVLQEYEIPAAVFAFSSNLISGRQPWWDALEDYLIANSCGERLSLEIDGELVHWPLRSTFERLRAYDELYELLSNRAWCDQEAIIAQIARNLKLEAPERDEHEMMNVQQLRKLDQTGLITVGGHAHNYVKLSSLSESEQAEEISKNKVVLEEVLGKVIRYFSYPLCAAGDVSVGTGRLLEENGFSLGCGGSYGVVGALEQINPFDLPRVKVKNWSVYEFHKVLERFLG